EAVDRPHGLARRELKIARLIEPVGGERQRDLIHVQRGPKATASFENGGRIASGKSLPQRLGQLESGQNIQSVGEVANGGGQVGDSLARKKNHVRVGGQETAILGIRP